MATLSKDAIKSLRADLAEARKRDVNFGVCLGRKPDATVLITHKSKSAEALAREAKKAGETQKTANGVLAVDGSNLNFTCSDEPPTGFAKILKGFVKAAGLTSMKVRILSADGVLLEDDGDPDEDASVEDGVEEPAIEDVPTEDDASYPDNVEETAPEDAPDQSVAIEDDDRDPFEPQPDPVGEASPEDDASRESSPVDAVEEYPENPESPELQAYQETRDTPPAEPEPSPLQEQSFERPERNEQPEDIEARETQSMVSPDEDRPGPETDSGTTPLQQQTSEEQGDSELPPVAAVEEDLSPLQRQWNEIAAATETMVEQARTVDDRVADAWGKIRAFADKGDLGTAVKTAEKLGGHLKTILARMSEAPAGVSPGASEAARKKWIEIEERLRGHVEAALKAEWATSVKIREMWNDLLARTKAELPDFAGAIKGAPALINLLKQGAAAGASAGGTAVAQDDEPRARAAGDGPGAAAAPAAPGGDIDTMPPPAAGDGSGAGVAPPPAADAGAAGAVAGSPGAGADDAPAAAAGDGPGLAATPPPPPKKADLSGDDAAKLARIETELTAINKLITDYMAIVPGSAEPKPPAWDKEVTDTNTFVTSMKAPGAVLETVKLDKALKDLAALANTINTKTAEKMDWKHALDLLNARLLTLDHHAQSGAAEIAPKIADIRTRLTAAETKANGQDFKGAIKAIGPLMTRCDEVELLADDCAHYYAVLTSRQNLVAGSAGNPATGVAKIDNMQAQCQDLLNKAAADAAADKFKDAVKKLDEIPPLHTEMLVLQQKKGDYDGFIVTLDAVFAKIDALTADQRKVLEPELAKFRKSYADAKVAVTGDYNASANLMMLLDMKEANFFEPAADALALYFPAKGAFETKFTEFTGHPGRAGIEEFYLAMQADKTQAEAEAVVKRFPAATGLYTRSAPRWAEMKKSADDYVDYTAKVGALKPLLDGMRAKPAAANGVAQADLLVTAAGKKALAKDYTAALADIVEAEARAADAKTAADSADALGALKDTAALDDMATDFNKAFQVYTDMRAHVDSADTTGTFRAEIAKADTPSAAAKTAATKVPPDYTEARTQLDAAILHLETILPKVLAWVPYTNHLSAAKMQINLNLPGQNTDNCIQPHLDEATTLLADAQALAAAPGYDIAGAEAKLTAAKVVTDAAQADSALYKGQVQGNIATINGIKTTLAAAANAAAVAFMGTRVARIDKYLTDIAADIAARKMKDAAKKAAEGAALSAPTNDEITDANTAITRKTNWYDVNLAAVTGNAICAPLIASAQEKLKVYTADMAKPNFAAAVETIRPANWDLVAAKKLLATAAAYTPLQVAAKAQLDALRAVRNPGVEDELKALEARYDACPGLIAADNYHRATIEMTEIAAACPALIMKAGAFQPYEDARLPAKARMDEAAAHKQASAIQPMIQRLTAKYADAEKRAAEGDYAAAKTLMDEIKADADAAIESADDHANIELVSGALDAAADTGILPEAVILATQVMLDRLNAKPEKVGATVELATALTQLTFAKAGVGATKAALKAAIAACEAADEKMSQYRMLEQSVNRATAQVAALKSHAEAAYVGDLLAPVDTAMSNVLPNAQATGDPIAQETALEALVVQLNGLQQLAEDHAQYKTVLAEPAVGAMVGILEQHTHRYAIKPSIDTMRKKLDEAAARDNDKKPGEAVKLLEEVRNIGASAKMMADMRDNIAPTPDEVKALLARPGGEAELDAMMANLEPDAQRAVLRVAFEARYGCKLNIYTYNAVTDVHTLDPIDGGKIGPNIQRFYELMSKLPPGDTTDNDSLLIWSEKQAGGSSFGGKEVIMSEGQDEFSGYYGFGRDFEVGGQDENCKPVDNEPVTRFSWNTLHEVGHAVDDKHGYMNANQSKPNHGGWQIHGREYGQVAKIFADHYGYDQTYVEQVMLEVANPAIPEVPAGGAVSPEEWEKRRISVTNHVMLALESSKPWNSNSQAERIAIGGRVYQESYPKRWMSYEIGARKQGMTGYQFRAPGEWFSELYAAYHIGKMKPDHPAAGWLATLAAPSP